MEHCNQTKKRVTESVRSAGQDKLVKHSLGTPCSLELASKTTIIFLVQWWHFIDTRIKKFGVDFDSCIGIQFSKRGLRTWTRSETNTKQIKVQKSTVDSRISNIVLKIKNLDPDILLAMVNCKSKSGSSLSFLVNLIIGANPTHS